MADAADERWVAEHGFLAENPLLDEILRVSDLLRENPEFGHVVQQRGLRGKVRRLLLRTGWHLYYRFSPEQQLIEILAVWYARRGGVPPL